MKHTGQIGIVGGGASAVCLLDALAESDGPAGGITVFEPSARLWRGRPYQPDLSAVRVNIPPAGMSIRFGDRGHFERWLLARDTAAHEDVLCGTRFVPRARYGDYLEDAADAAIRRLSDRGWRVSLVRDRVESAVAHVDGLTIHTEHGFRVPVRQAVLCVGRPRPSDVYGLGGAPGFIAEPYPLAHRLHGVEPDADVAVLGSGLTGVDVVLSLVASGHRGRIRMLSRSGVLPAVRQRVVPYTLRHFTPDVFRAAAAAGRRVTLAELVATMRAELASAGHDFDRVAAEITAIGREDPEKRLRRQLADVDSPDLGLRILQAAVPATGPDVWPLLPDEEKSAALRLHYRAVMSLCCPMPPSSAAQLVELLDSGQLEIISGVRDIASTGAGFTIRTEDSDHTDEQGHTAAVLVNAVNVPANKIPTQARSLVDSLVHAGLAVPHPLGGLHVERATSRLTVGDIPNSRLYALGDLAAGALFFTFGLPSLVDRAHDIAEAIRAEAWDVPRPRFGETLQTV